MSKKEEIKEYVAQFVEGLTKRMRAAAHESVDVVFADGDEGETPAPARAAKAKRTRSSKRAKAPQQSTEAPSDNKKLVLAAVRANPGAHRSTICHETNLAGWQVTPILTELVATSAIKKSGAGRGTTYSTR